MPVKDLDEEDEDHHLWLLGFLEEPDDVKSLLRHTFPSKVGGRPAWLDPVAIPPQNALISRPSGRPLNFLLQVYSPLDDSPLTFHRTIFLFVPQDGKEVRTKGNVRAFRSQLQRKNDFYGYEPSKDPYPKSLPGADHRADLWRVLEYEARLASNEPVPELDDRNLFPEKLLVIDEEQSPPLPIRPQHLQEDADMQASDVSPDVEAAIASNTTPDQRHFAEFAARISWDPEQVLRYCFQEGAEPLWPSSCPVPTEADIPPCYYCSGRRRFEFQVMPQLLSSLDIDDEQESALDWGTLAVYSCEASCDVGAAYAEEFVWVQP